MAKSIKKILIRVILGFTIVFVLVVGLFIVPYFANIVMPWDRAGAIESTCAWGGLAELPASAEDISIQTEGSMFTREYIIKFNCPATDIEKWIADSDGLKNIEGVSTTPGVVSYQVSGREGSIGGTVTVDKIKGKVIIDMSWS
jgi:hypothetical protein